MSGSTRVASAPNILPAKLPVSQGLVTMAVATVILVVFALLFAKSSTTPGAVLGMLPFAAVLAIVGLGQMLVVQQGGIDLSVPGAMSLTIVVVSHQPNGIDERLLPAVFTAIAFALVAGLLNGLMIGWLGLNAIIATLGTNALFFGAVLGISGGTPRSTTRLLASIAGGGTLGIPNSIIFAGLVLLVVAVALKKTVAGRRFEAIGSNAEAARAAGLRVRTHRTLSYVWAQLLYTTAALILAGITAQPTAFQGESYLLPSVAVVVLGGTSLLGGRGFPVATVVAALFLSFLDQVVLALGVPYAVRTLIQAAALVVGVAIYTMPWARVRERLRARSTPESAPV